MNNPCRNCKSSILIYRGNQEIAACGRYPNICEKRIHYDKYNESRRAYKRGDTRLNSIEEIKEQNLVWLFDKPIDTRFVLRMTGDKILEYIEFGVWTVEKKG